MADTATPGWVASREQLLHALYEAAEIEHNLMCTYLYAAFSLKTGVEEGLTVEEAEATARWRRSVLDVAIDEMGRLAAVWNITSALGGQPRFGRGNFPLDFGLLPAGIVVKLAPFSADVLQHFIYLERPEDSTEPEGEGFETRLFRRGSDTPRLTPMPLDYETVGAFYHQLGATLRRFSESHGETVAFAGDPALQLGPSEIDLGGAKPVLCLKTALQAFDAIVTQGEGASAASATSHFCTFRSIRDEFAALKTKNPDFVPAWPAAVNPVLRRPPTPEGKVWIEAPEAIATVDLANSCYQLMLRLLGYAYSVKHPHPEKAAAVDLAVALMRAATLLGERAARLPAGPSNPHCRAGMSFTALRDSAPFTQGDAARRFFVERLHEFAEVSAELAAGGDARARAAAKLIAGLAVEATQRFAEAGTFVEVGKAAVAAPAASPPSEPLASGSEASTQVDGVETVQGEKVVIAFEAKRCIQARFCVTGAPKVFLANVEGPWIHPNAMDAEKAGRDCRSLPLGRDPVSAQGWAARRNAAAGQSCKPSRGRPLCGAWRCPAQRQASWLSHDAVPVRGLEEQTVLRFLAPRDRLFRLGRAADGQGRHAGGSRRAAGDRSADRWTAPGARQSRNHRRDGPGGGARPLGAALPLRPVPDQAVLRRIACEGRFPELVVSAPAHLCSGPPRSCLAGEADEIGGRRPPGGVRRGSSRLAPKGA